MKIIDYFFYLTYRFLNIKVGRNEDDAKWSALIHTSLYATLFIETFVYLTGLIYKNNLINTYASFGYFGLFILYVFLLSLFYLKFYKYSSINLIESNYNHMKLTKNKYIKLTVFFLMIFIPVFWYIIRRLYQFGHI